MFDAEDCQESLRDLNTGGFSLPALQNLVSLIKKSRAAYDIYSEDAAADYRQVVARLFAERRGKVLSLCVDNRQRPDDALAAFIERQGAELALRSGQAPTQMPQRIHSALFGFRMGFTPILHWRAQAPQFTQFSS